MFEKLPLELINIILEYEVSIKNRNDYQDRQDSRGNDELLFIEDEAFWAILFQMRTLPIVV